MAPELKELGIKRSLTLKQSFHYLAESMIMGLGQCLCIERVSNIPGGFQPLKFRQHCWQLAYGD